MRSTPIYEVHAVKYAHLPRKAWEVQITPDPHDADFPMDYFVWVAMPLDESGHRTIGGKPIVIDTGFNAPVGKKRGREVKTNPADLLQHLGVDAKEVEDVIITHLHYDHVGNWDRFPKARFHLQDKEMQFATGRHICHGTFRHAFEIEDIVGMVRAVYGKRVVFHDGDEEVQPGISVHLIGGHTMGMQSVRVMTRNGWLVLASDASHYYWGIEDKKLFSIVFSVADMLAGYDKLQKLADGRLDMVVPGHDAEVMKRYPASTPDLKGVSVRLDYSQSGRPPAPVKGGRDARGQKKSFFATSRVPASAAQQSSTLADRRRRGEPRGVMVDIQHAQLDLFGDCLLLGRIGFRGKASRSARARDRGQPNVALSHEALRKAADTGLSTSVAPGK
jgi:glyoxylase-like metal-dependent hydrolase (beta-lactamase superfamily II)